ncbi:MAG TPA: hypothetical protein VGB89_05010 [Bacteroidota bacterium]
MNNPAVEETLPAEFAFTKNCSSRVARKNFASRVMPHTRIAVTDESPCSEMQQNVESGMVPVLLLSFAPAATKKDVPEATTN